MSDVRISGSQLQRPTVVVMSDVRLYREGLARALASRDEVLVTGDVSVTSEGIARLAILDPDIVLLEASAARMRENIASVIASSARSRVVAFAVADEEHDALRCTEAGAAGYVPRDASIDDLTATIVRVSHGEFPCSPRVAALLARRLTSLAAHQPKQDAAGARSSLLTAREREVVRLIDDGLSNKEISSRLGIGVSTVKNHVHHILDKTNASRRSQAAARMRRTSGATSSAATPPQRI